jgi:hypothetical protein
MKSQLLEGPIDENKTAADLMSLQSDEHGVKSSLQLCSEWYCLLEELPSRQLYPPCLCVSDDHNASK